MSLAFNKIANKEREKWIGEVKKTNKADLDVDEERET